LPSNQTVLDPSDVQVHGHTSRAQPAGTYLPHTTRESVCDGRVRRDGKRVPEFKRRREKMKRMKRGEGRGWRGARGRELVRVRAREKRMVQNEGEGESQSRKGRKREIATQWTTEEVGKRKQERGRGKEERKREYLTTR
jgi:hypothetical protein